MKLKDQKSPNLKGNLSETMQLCLNPFQASTLAAVQKSHDLNTASQVNTVSHSFYEQHLSEIQMKPLDDLLELESANSQTV